MLPEIARMFAARALELEGRAADESVLRKLAVDATRVSLPAAGESVGVSFYEPKTASLLFDRVWCLPNYDARPPEGVGVFGGTDMEMLCAVMARGLASKLWTSDTSSNVLKKTEVPVTWRGLPIERTIAQELAASFGFSATPILPSIDALHLQYQPGDVSVLLASLRQVPVVDDAKLEWEQVMEFRTDPDARSKYRRFVRWLDETLVGRTPEFIADTIASRREDYDWSIRKHGFKVVTGTLTTLVDPKFLAATAAMSASLALSGAPPWSAAVATLASILGRAGLSVANETIELVEATRSGRDIAFVRQVAEMTDR